MANIYEIHTSKIITFDELVDEIRALLVAKRTIEQLSSALVNIAANTKHTEYSTLDKYFQLVTDISLDFDASHWTALEDTLPAINNNNTEDNDFIQLVLKASSGRNQYEEQYSFFEPAYRFADVLGSVFKDLNPAIIIGDYLNLIFPKNQRRFNIHGERSFSLKRKSTSAKFLYNVGVEILRICSADKEIKDIYNLTLIAIFYWENEIIDNGFTKPQRLENQATIISLFKNFFRYPDYITDIWLNAFDIDGRLDDSYVFGEDEHGNFFNDPKTPSNNYFLNKISKSILPLLSHLRLKEFGIAYAQGKKRISFTTLVNIAYMLRDEVFNPREDTIRELCRFLEEYKLLRVNICNEVVPFCSPEDLEAYYHVVRDEINENELDFTVLISRARYDFGDLACSYHSSTNRNAFEFRQSFQHNYIQLVKSIRSAGYTELSAAVLSFYIFSHAFVHKGSIGELRIIIPLIDEALKSIGKEMVFRALDFVVEISEIFPGEPGNLLLARVLKKYIKQSSIRLVKNGDENKSSRKKLIQEKHRNSKEEVIDDLYDYFGKERLQKLQNTSFEYLVDAEWTWSNFFRYQGREKKEWSNIIIGYCLVIENELLSHFQTMLKEFRELQGNLSAEVTLGSAVWALLNKKKSMEFTCAVNKSKLYLLSENKNLLSKLRNFAKKYRNKASHATPLLDIDIVEFRKEFFEGGLLKGLLDSL